jgi:hypothetical protein
MNIGRYSWNSRNRKERLLDDLLDKLVEWLNAKPIKINLSRPSELKLRELTEASYDLQKQLEGARVVLGRKIGKEDIRLLIASVVNDWRQEPLLSLGRIKNRI